VGSRRTSARVVPGAISLRSSSHFALIVLEQQKASGVTSRSRQTFDEACADRIGRVREYDRHRAGRLKHYLQSTTKGQNDVWGQRDQFCCIFAIALESAFGKAIINLHIVAISPAQLLQSLLEGRETQLVVLIVHSREHSDLPHPLALLRPCRKRPRRRRAA